MNKDLKRQQSSNSKFVDMPSSAISSRLREVSELHQIGLSLSKAKPLAKLPQSHPEHDTTNPKSVEDTGLQTSIM